MTETTRAVLAFVLMALISAALTRFVVTPVVASIVESL